MKRIVSILGFTFLAAVAATPASADQRRPFDGARPEGGGLGLHRLHRCLSRVELSSDQRAAIDGIISAAKPAIQADLEALKAAQQKVEADFAAGADKCAVGGDVLARHADAEKLHEDIASVRQQVLAKLTPDQQSRVQGCFQERDRRR